MGRAIILALALFALHASVTAEAKILPNVEDPAGWQGSVSGENPACQFILGFKTVKDFLPDVVGDCIADETHNVENGDGLQPTTKGLMVWRKADNFTAFTDGYRSWINGPNGTQQRLNTQRFAWEGDAQIVPNIEIVKDGTPLARVGQAAEAGQSGPAVTAIGDSVMLGATPELRSRLGNVTVYATISRQAEDAVALVQSLNSSGKLAPYVLIHVGNNGTFTAGQFDQIMAAAGPDRKAAFVTVRVDRKWQAPNNEVITSGVARYSNAMLLDWYAASAGRPEYFWADGIHLRSEGARAYAGLIAPALGR